MTASSPALAKARRTIFDYRAIWRWHFYAGLFCAPFVILLAITGSIYLFKPQVEAWLDRPYDHLTLTGKPVSAQAQVDAALKAVPGSGLRTYEVRRQADDAARIVVGKKGENILVYVHPETLQILKVINESDRLMEVDKTIHGELLMGDNGSILVELAACWAIVMVVTGLYLWWPRQAQGLGGVLYPRLGRGSKLFWRDIHAVTGVWISSLVLFLLLTGLPWAKVWGDSFKEVRRLTGTAVANQDWSNSRAGEKAERKALDAPAASEHEGHMAGMDMAGMDMATMSMEATPALNRMVATVQAMDLPPPVLIAPPSGKKGRNASPDWTARSDTPNRPQRVTLTLDPGAAEVIRTETFASRHPIDKVIGYGIAAHEGQLFGWVNQLLGVLAALGLITLSISGLVIWWRRRPDGQLGAPPALPEGRVAMGVGILIVAFCVLLPVLGLSMIVIALIEHLALRHIPGVRHWLGLRQANLEA